MPPLPGRLKYGTLGTGEVPEGAVGARLSLIRRLSASRPGSIGARARTSPREASEPGDLVGWAADALDAFAGVAEEGPHVAVLGADDHACVRLADALHPTTVATDTFTTWLGVIAENGQQVMHTQLAAAGSD